MPEEVEIHPCRGGSPLSASQDLPVEMPCGVQGAHMVGAVEEAAALGAVEVQVSAQRLAVWQQNRSRLALEMALKAKEKWTEAQQFEARQFEA